MQSTLKINGMTCQSCVAQIENALTKINEIDKFEVSLKPPTAFLSFRSPIALARLNDALRNLIGSDRYSFQMMDEPAAQNAMAVNAEASAESTVSEKSSYYPLALVFMYLIGFSIWRGYEHATGHVPNNHADPFIAGLMGAMNGFMGGFFIVFSFFKILNVKAFADAFGRYDIIAKKSRLYAIIYPFIELTLGILYISGFDSIGVDIIMALLMGVGLYGVVQSVRSKKTIQCACLGTVFNLPMSQVTIWENSIMIAMALAMIALR